MHLWTITLAQLHQKSLYSLFMVLAFLSFSIPFIMVKECIKLSLREHLMILVLNWLMICHTSILMCPRYYLKSYLFQLPSLDRISYKQQIKQEYFWLKYVREVLESNMILLIIYLGLNTMQVISHLRVMPSVPLLYFHCLLNLLTH